jgi:hypothetical protein
MKKRIFYSILGIGAFCMSMNPVLADTEALLIILIKDMKGTDWGCQNSTWDNLDKHLQTIKKGMDNRVDNIVRDDKNAKSHPLYADLIKTAKDVALKCFPNKPDEAKRQEALAKVDKLFPTGKTESSTVKKENQTPSSSGSEAAKGPEKIDIIGDFANMMGDFANKSTTERLKYFEDQENKIKQGMDKKQTYIQDAEEEISMYTDRALGTVVALSNLNQLTHDQLKLFKNCVEFANEYSRVNLMSFPKVMIRIRQLFPEYIYKLNNRAFSPKIEKYMRNFGSTELSNEETRRIEEHPPKIVG